jgi:hypothetical protein
MTKALEARKQPLDLAVSQVKPYPYPAYSLQATAVRAVDSVHIPMSQRTILPKKLGSTARSTFLRREEMVGQDLHFVKGSTLKIGCGMPPLQMFKRAWNPSEKLSSSHS